MTVLDVEDQRIDIYPRPPPRSASLYASSNIRGSRKPSSEIRLQFRSDGVSPPASNCAGAIPSIMINSLFIENRSRGGEQISSSFTAQQSQDYEFLDEVLQLPQRSQSHTYPSHPLPLASPDEEEELDSDPHLFIPYKVSEEEVQQYQITKKNLQLITRGSSQVQRETRWRESVDYLRKVQALKWARTHDKDKFKSFNKYKTVTECQEFDKEGNLIPKTQIEMDKKSKTKHFAPEFIQKILEAASQPIIAVAAPQATSWSKVSNKILASSFIFNNTQLKLSALIKPSNTVNPSIEDSKQPTTIQQKPPANLQNKILSPPASSAPASKQRSSSASHSQRINQTTTPSPSLAVSSKQSPFPRVPKVNLNASPLANINEKPKQQLTMAAAQQPSINIPFSTNIQQSKAAAAAAAKNSHQEIIKTLGVIIEEISQTQIQLRSQQSQQQQLNHHLH